MNEPLLPEQIRALDYLARKGTAAPAATIHKQTFEAFAAIEQAFDGVATEKRERAPAIGKWSPHEILDHLVLSHEPAIAQLENLLRGESDNEAIPADLHRPASERPEWTLLRSRLGETHRKFLALLESATDSHSLEPKAAVVMVIKVDGQPKHWIQPLDWKAFAQGIRVHTMEHHKQLEKVLSPES